MNTDDAIRILIVGMGYCVIWAVSWVIWIALLNYQCDLWDNWKEGLYQTKTDKLVFFVIQSLCGLYVVGWFVLSSYMVFTDSYSLKLPFL